MTRSRKPVPPNAFDRKAVQYRTRALELAAIAEDGKHRQTARQLHQLSAGYCKLAHQMDELSDIEQRLRRH